MAARRVPEIFSAASAPGAGSRHVERRMRTASEGSKKFLLGSPGYRRGRGREEG